MNNKEFTKKYYIDRKKSNTVKWNNYKKDKVLPMWIADMDFKCDERVIEALNKHIETADFGYSNLPEDYYKAFNDWHLKRNNIEYKQEWIRFSKGAVDAMNQIIHSFTKQGDEILINTPLYPPFKATIKQCKRKVVECKMINNDGYFLFDYKKIEKTFKERKIKMLMLCSPHNPVSRVFKQGELEELFELCHKYHVLICSDEVHSDIIMPDQKFIPALSFKKYQDEIISIIAASKTFSLAVFSHCHIVIPNEKLRRKLITYQQDHHLGSVNVFNALPTYYNYKYGEEWLNSLNNVIFENYNYFRKELSQYLEMTTLEGSYLIFVNFKGYYEGNVSEYLKKNCHIWLNDGETFDPKYKDWARVNLATSLENVKLAARNIKKILI